MDDSTTTIEFLRARLLSERTVSKAAKERADQLAKRVMELEEQLKVMSIQRRKVEEAAMKAISILETYGINNLHDAIESSSDKDESPSVENGREETFEEDEDCTASQVVRIVVEDAQSSSKLEVFPSQVGSLSWKSHTRSPDSARKLKGKQFRQRQRRISLMSPVESSPKHNLGKPCYKTKQKEMGSTSEGKGDDYVVNADDQPELYLNDSGSWSSFVTVEKKEADATGLERDEEMERVLEQQALLIGQYEAEEKAQREWEKKFTENKISNPDYAEPEKQSHIAVINSDSQKSSSAIFDKIPYEDKGAKPSTGILSRTVEPGCLSDGPVLKLSAGAAQGVINGGQDANNMETSNASVSANLPRKGGEHDDSQVYADGLMSQVGNRMAVSDIEACHVEVAFPAKVSTASSSLGKQNQGRVYENSEAGSSNNINLLRHTHIKSPLVKSPSASSRREILKWELSGTEDPSYMKPSQSAGISLGGVLEALQRAKVSLKQELHKLPVSGQGTKALPAANRTTVSDETLEVPMDSAGLLRLPTHTSPQAHNSENEFHRPRLSFTAAYPHLGYAITNSDNHNSTIPHVDGGSKNSMGTKLNFGNYHPGMDLPASVRHSLPYSGLTADRMPFSGLSLGKQHFNTYSQGVGIPSLSRYSLPSNVAGDGTMFPGRSESPVHRQYFDPYRPVRYSLPYSALTRDRTIVHGGISKPHTDARNEMPPRDQSSLYSGNGTRSNTRIL